MTPENKFDFLFPLIFVVGLQSV